VAAATAAGVEALYGRIHAAARRVCEQPAGEPAAVRGCMTKTESQAIGKVDAPLLTAIYQKKKKKLRPGPAGSVLRAIDLRDVRASTACVLKQARPHCSVDELGRDRRARLRHQGAVLARLRGLAGIGPAGEYFEDEDTGYLPVAYMPGQTLAELVYQLARAAHGGACERRRDDACCATRPNSFAACAPRMPAASFIATSRPATCG